MSSLIASIEGIQKEVCQLGAGNCKAICGNKLDEFKQRVKDCFSISSSIDEALKQAKSSENNSVCYSDLKTAAESYKRLSLKGKSELREDLSVQDIVDCKGLRKSGKAGAAVKKAVEVCNETNKELLLRQQQEQAKKEELERQAREKERLEELEREKEEEFRRKEEAFKKRARMIQADMGYIENKGALDSQTQGQAYGGGAIKPSEIKTPKEPVKKETAEKDKEKTEDKKPDSEKEDKSEEDKKEDEKLAEKEKKTEKQKADSSKSNKESKDENSNKLKSSKQNRADKVKTSASTDSSQKSSLQTSTKALKSQKAPPKKTTAKKKPSNNPNNLKAFSAKTTTSQTKSPAPVQSSEKALSASLAGNTINKNCPVSMPQIKSAIVYQSVTAPQIEPMNQQEFQSDPDNPNFRSYDLVMGKPAGVLVELDKARMDRKKEFALDLKIAGEKKFRTKCFHEPIKKDNLKGQEDYCFFKKSHLENEGLFKFFTLPMKASFLNKDRLTLSIKITLYPRGLCKK